MELAEPVDRQTNLRFDVSRLTQLPLLAIEHFFHIHRIPSALNRQA